MSGKITAQPIQAKSMTPAPAPPFSATPAHRSALAHPLFDPLRSARALQSDFVLAVFLLVSENVPIVLYLLVCNPLPLQ